MKTFPKTLERVLFAAAVVIAFTVFVAPAIRAQMQQSGGPGSTVSLGSPIPAGTNDIGKVDVQTVPADPFGANADAASASGSISAKLRFIAATGIPITALPALASGSNIIGKVAPVTACGTTSFSQAIAALPTSSTAITTTTTCILAAYFNNTNSSAQTVTLTDNAGTPLNIIGPAFSVPGLSNMTVPLYGIQATSGIKWAAGGTGVTGGVVGLQ